MVAAPNNVRAPESLVRSNEPSSAITLTYSSIFAADSRAVAGTAVEAIVHASSARVEFQAVVVTAFPSSAEEAPI
jgi:hypothetical protein